MRDTSAIKTIITTPAVPLLPTATTTQARA